eukprot:3700517-Prymnesium_polylepis.1
MRTRHTCAPATYAASLSVDPFACTGTWTSSMGAVGVGGRDSPASTASRQLGQRGQFYGQIVVYALYAA